jgi:serine/threonine protein kinase
MPQLDPKAVWPGWKTVKLIGKGSFGTVYEIERQDFDHLEKAALKVISIPQNDSDLDDLYDSGYDEASVTATFKSHLKSIVNEYSLMREMNGTANVVNCDDYRVVQRDEGIGWDIYIKMELVTPITKAVPLVPSDEQVVRIGEDMCQALILCGKYGIIHRDIKPQNIFVSKNGDYKLGDFGIAKTVEKTTGGTKIGTYKYMAPEVYNNQPYNQTVDIYSLGLVLHWLLNEHRQPFVPLPPVTPTASLEEEARLRRFKGEPVPAPAHGSEELKQIVLKACAYDPKERYQSAEEMLEDLENLGVLKTSQRTVPKVVDVIKAPETSEERNRASLFMMYAADGIKPETQKQEILKEENIGDDGTIGLFGFDQERKDNASEDLEEKASRSEKDEKKAEEHTPKENNKASVVVATETLPNMDAENEGTVGVFGGLSNRKTVDETVYLSESHRPIEQQKGKNEETPGDEQNKKKGIWIAIGIIAIILVVAFFTIHIWTEATCTTPATCKICGRTKGTALGHHWMDATCTTPRTCSICGETEGNALGHAWKDATCTSPQTCSRCGATKGNSLGHDWRGATCTDPQTCARCGATTDYALGHAWIDATCTEPRTCTRCGATQGDALGHAWKDATCTSPQTCTRCGATGEAALDHNWIAATYDAPATCSRCGLTKGSRKYYSDNYQIGDIFVKGHYEQDNNSSNGKEAIEWIVIGKDKDSLLLLSRYCLDRITYADRDDANNKWAYSSLRTWLNNVFIKQAFSESEISHLNGAEDKVFCLSWGEYISITDEQIAYGHPTIYAKARGAEVFRDTFCPWWLRITTEEEKTSTIIVWVNQDQNGILTTYWTNLTNDGITVRPAVWYNLRD